MRDVFTLQTVITALIFGTIYALVLAVIGQIAVEHWGRPRGVAYGILGYYYWLGLSIFGFVMAFVFVAMPPKSALLVSVTIITVPTVLLLPDRGERPFLSVYLGAIVMCLGLAAWRYYRSKLHEQAG